MWKVEYRQDKFDPTRHWKTHCGGNYRADSPISTFFNHSLYLWWDIGSLEVLWNPWINPNIPHLGVKRRALWGQNRHQPWLNSQGVEFVVDDEFKSQTCKTIHYTHGERMERLRCFEFPKSVQTSSILVLKVDEGQAHFDPIRDWNTHCGDHFRTLIPISTFSNHSLYLWWDIGRVEMLWNPWINPNMLHLGVKRRVLRSRNHHHQWPQSQGAALVVDDEFKSQPCKTIHYTYGERMEGLRCCDLTKSVQTHSILV